jgi:hypothetical protein
MATLTPAQRRAKIAKERAQIAAKKKATAAHPAQDTLSVTQLRQQYGWILNLLDSDPKLKTLFTNAVNGGWTEARFQAALRNTTWYKTHSESFRNAELMRYTDPKQWNQRNLQQQADIQAKATALGATLLPADLKRLAYQSLQGAWTDSQMMTTLAGFVPGQAAGAHPGGSSGQAFDEIRKLSADYMIPYSNDKAATWAVKIATGQSTMEDALTYFKENAKLQNPYMSAAIDAGHTVTEYLDPYRQQAAQTLGIIPDAIDWTQAKWQQIFSATDPKTGQVVPLSLADSTKKIKNDPVYGYDQSAPGQNERSTFGHQMLNMFGFSPAGG